jgi:hypothetical protein
MQHNTSLASYLLHLGTGVVFPHITYGMFAGFADYGVNVNPLKTRLSFDMTTSSGTHLQVRYKLT